MAKKFKLTEDRFGHKKGLIVYEFLQNDYGIVRDDSVITGIHHIAVTESIENDYPFFSIPEEHLEEIK